MSEKWAHYANTPAALMNDPATRALAVDIARAKPRWKPRVSPREPWLFAETTGALWDLDALTPFARDPDQGLPHRQNWRSRLPLCRPLDQGEFNIATSLAVVGVMSDLLVRTHAEACQLSPAHLHWCLAGHAGDDPLSLRDALACGTNDAVAEWSDYPLPMSAMNCAAAKGVARIGEVFRLVTSDDAIIALQHGPIIGIMDLYDDFWRFFGRGEYHHVAGGLLGSHPVVVVGYNRISRYWVIKNSRGHDWGDGGYARIAFGECRLFTEDGLGGVQITLRAP